MKENIFPIIAIFGLVLCGSALIMYLNAPMRTAQFDSVKLYSGSYSVPANSWSYLGTPEDGIAFFVDNASMLVKFSTENGRLTLHIMNESQFADWKLRGNASNSLITQANVSSFDYLIKPKIAETCYFIFENPEPQGSSFNYSAEVSGNFLRFDFGLTYFYLALLIFGGAIFSAGFWKSSKKIAKWHNNWVKPRVKTRYSQDKAPETQDIYTKSASLTRKMVKYSLLSLFAIIVATYLPFLEQIPYIVNFHFFSPDYNTALCHYFIRTFIFRFFTPLPTAICFASAVVILLPRLADLSTLIQVKLHFVGPKQSEINKELWGGLVKLVVSKKFIGLMIAFLLPLMLIRFVFSFYDSRIYLVYVASIASILGLYLGFKLALLLVDCFHRLNVKDYAWRHFMFGALISVVTIASVLSAVVYVTVAFNVSGYYMSFLNNAFFSHVQLLQPFSLLASNSIPQNLPVIAAILVFGAVMIMFLFIFIIPFLYRFTVNELLSALIVFVTVEVTQELTRVLLAGTLANVFEPLSVFAPISAAVVAALLHRHFKKMVKKIMKRSSQDSADMVARTGTLHSK
jgi:hypothetical protein